MNKSSLVLALAGIPFLRADEKFKVLDNLDNLKALTLLSIEDISIIAGRHIRSSLWQPAGLVRRIERVLQIMQSWAIQWCVYGDDSYPALLRELYDPPFALFWRGILPSAERSAAAVVGTRKPSAAGTKAAFELGRELSQAGVPVVSGLACGIDGSAHRGAAGGPGNTAAVLACGVDQIYPAANRSLAARMIETGGCIVSEYLPGDEPLKWRFVQRNRLISGLSRITAVIEAPEKSGALITADYTLEQGRDLCIHSVCLGSSASGAGGRRYIDDGAPVVCTAEDVLRLLRGDNLNFTEANKEFISSVDGGRGLKAQSPAKKGQPVCMQPDFKF